MKAEARAVWEMARGKAPHAPRRLSDLDGARLGVGARN